jgi:tRNA pseudouridine13 synthase
MTDELPYATDGAPIAGRIRAQADDFRVQEVPAYPPSGEGDHLYVHFEKTELDTPEAVRRIARALGSDPREAGFAGLKDRKAITSQWASFLFGDPSKLEAPIDGVRILEHARHRNKLRTGHLKANRFEILLRDALPTSLSEAQDRLTALASRGIPNYYGEQRFGSGSLDAARRWLVDGGRAPRKPFDRKMLVSVAQSAMFNAILADRVRDGTFAKVLPGDLAKREDSGGVFVAGAEDAERAERFEISATGPMFGADMAWPEGEALAREEAELTKFGLSRERLNEFRRAGAGTRRPLRVRLSDVSVEAHSQGLLLRFALPSGAYATIVLRELSRQA